jgi:hypothetical protein
MGSLGSLSALSDIKGVLLPALREDRKREKAEVKRGDVGESRVKDEDEEEVQEVEIGRGGVKVAKVEIGAA